ncbi:MAG TPA: 23S rRNA (adenine(2030)-N(6))-methyltransferase RlmJ [Rhizomicrobium sp.]|nr:23S rRNA (adenine(2030)-N(6))-methyltransferase RlmJ [Rhizomicrobium sp.]
MNYRHAFHAGNFADVIKHIALVAVILHLRRKEKPFCVIDTHAGAGIYDLGSLESARTGEAAEGIGRLGGVSRDPHYPEALRIYLDCVNDEGEGRYPGSARLASRLLRPQDRLIAIERSSEAATALRSALARFSNARAIEGDGYERLLSLLPPPERRGAILVDPPYESDDEFKRAADVLARAHRRFATGIYLVWYPIKSRAAADALYGEVRAHGITSALCLEIDTGRPGTDRERLSAAGVLVVNPPFGFDEAMREVAAVLAPLLGPAPYKPACITLVSTPP